MSSELQKLRERLNHLTMAWKPTMWLDTGVPDLNRVLGHRSKGVPYGRVIEISGLESGGKTAISMSLAALAQRNKAFVQWGDLETSMEPDWAMQRGILKCPECKGTGRIVKGVACPKCGNDIPCSLCGGSGCKECKASGKERGMGLDPDWFQLFTPYVGTFSYIDHRTKKVVREKEPRLSTGEEICQEIEAFVKLKSQKYDGQFLVIDSIPSLLTEGELSAGLTETNLHTNMELPKFLGRLLRRWVGIAQAYNVLIILVNQMRQNPMAGRYNSWYTPGGNAPHFYCHGRVRVIRIGPMLKDKGENVGIQGTMLAMKNKMGGEQKSTVGYKLLFKSALEFVPASEIKRKGEE